MTPQEKFDTGLLVSTFLFLVGFVIYLLIKAG